MNKFIIEHNLIYHEISSSNNNLEEIFKAFVSNIIQNENITDCKGMKDISSENKRVTISMKKTKNDFCCFQ